jgi:hypothetical protein
LRRLDRLTARLGELAQEGKCTFQDTLSRVTEPVNAISYQTVFDFFKSHGAGNSRSQFSGNVMHMLFTMRTPADERVVRFYCVNYHQPPGVCNCKAVILQGKPGARIRYKALTYISVARGWLMDRADLLALTDEQLAAVKEHPNTRQHLVDFIEWLRANPDAT